MGLYLFILIQFTIYSLVLGSDTFCNYQTCRDATTCYSYRCKCRHGPGLDNRGCATTRCFESFCRNGGWCYYNRIATISNFLCPTGSFYSSSAPSLCANNPCRNGAPCTDIATSPNYRCTCPSNWYGVNCSLTICDLGYCLNNATCQRTRSSALGYSCSCRPGFSGYNCTTDICNFGYCSNNSTCQRIATTPNYSCSCRPGFTGYNCSTDLCQPNPCNNGGTCIALPGSARCQCLLPYFGRNCDINGGLIGLGVILFLLLLSVLIFVLYRLKNKKKVVPQRIQDAYDRRFKQKETDEKKIAGNEEINDGDEVKVSTQANVEVINSSNVNAGASEEQKTSFNFSVVVSQLRRIQTTLSESLRKK